MLQIEKETLDEMLVELKGYLQAAITSKEVEKKIYRLYGTIESELKIRNMLAEDSDFLDKELTRYKNNMLKVAMSESITIRGQKFLLVPVSTEDHPIEDAPFEDPKKVKECGD